MTVPTLEAGRLTLVCADRDARPLLWSEADGSRHGFEPAVAARPGLETCWQIHRWADFESALETGVVGGEPRDIRSRWLEPIAYPDALARAAD